MTKERELLERAASMLPFISEESRGFYPAVALVSEIRFHLANDEKTHNTQSVYPEQQALHPEQESVNYESIDYWNPNEPVAWWNGITPEMSEDDFWRARLVHYGVSSAKTEDCDIPLFLHPSPQAEQRKPLTIDECMKRWDIVKQSGHVDRATFIAGVRFAEKHHGISDGHPDN